MSFMKAKSAGLSPEDEPDRLFIQLYHMNVRDTDLEGKEVLEIGSGRGGGASWISRTMNPKSLVVGLLRKGRNDALRVFHSGKFNIFTRQRRESPIQRRDIRRGLQC